MIDVREHSFLAYFLVEQSCRKHTGEQNNSKDMGSISISALTNIILIDVE